MAYLVDHDPLTGLYNRRYFEKELRRDIDEHRRLGESGAILWFDLDHFKDINDSLGHAAGDDLLGAFGHHLRGETRSYCTVARLGGDEFGMLVPHVQGQAAAKTAARLVEGLSSRTFAVGDHDVRISASVGVVTYPDQGDQTTDLLAHADIAMYDAKAKGGNQAIAYVQDDRWQTEMTERLKTGERIVAAMHEDRLTLYAQPIRGARAGGRQAFELLLRMHDENGDLVLPDEIIPTAERLGLIRDIDRWVARRSIGLLALASQQKCDVEFWINLSGCAFSDPMLLDVIRTEIASTGADPERLVIEITETTTIANIEEARKFIKTLSKIGCRFSLDDFGSGASSFYYLKHLPIDFIKIDGGIVTGLDRHPADAHFVGAIVEMCRGLKIRTVAEWVESQPILDAINKSGVDFVQGYHIGMPEPLDVYLGDAFAEGSE
jgi:diguanylate cyclase (GGDEF)-like protein